jgi:O-antigen ligase
MMAALLIFGAISQGVTTLSALRILAVVLLGLSLFLIAVGIHQRFAPTMCIIDAGFGDGLTGIPCEVREDCYRNTLDYGRRHGCEHVGLFNVTSYLGRVRFWGILNDPNELAVMATLAIPLALAFVAERFSMPRVGLAVVATIGAGLCTIFTQSRSGQLAFTAILGVYLLGRMGRAGIVAAAVLAAPIALLGGRSDVDADASSESRIELWMDGLRMFAGSPLFGVGNGQFTDHARQTAHNSLVLALAENGAVGAVLFATLNFLAIRIAWRLRRWNGPDARSLRIWATAVLSAMCGLMVSAFFLSFSWKVFLWIYLGMAGSLSHIAFRRDSAFRAQLTRRDLAPLLGGLSVVIAAIYVLGRSKGF